MSGSTFRKYRTSKKKFQKHNAIVLFHLKLKENCNLVKNHSIMINKRIVYDISLFVYTLKNN